MQNRIRVNAFASNIKSVANKSIGDILSSSAFLKFSGYL